MEEKRNFKPKTDKKFNKNKDFKKGRSFDSKEKPDRSFKGKKDDFKKKDNFNGKNSFKDKKIEKKVEEVKENVEQTSNVRFYIFQCLYNIYVNKAFSNIEIDHTIRKNNINELDAKLLTNVVYGTLSHDKVLNWEIKQLCEKEPKDQAKVIILMSLYQLKYLDSLEGGQCSGGDLRRSRRRERCGSIFR